MLSDEMNNIHLLFIAVLWATAMLDKNTSLWCSTWSVKKRPERTSALSGSSRCASSPNPDDIFPSPVIPTGHIMTFNNTVRGAHKSTDKNPEVISAPGYFSLMRIITDAHRTKDRHTRSTVRERGSAMCDVWPRFAICGIWYSESLPLLL